MGGRRREAAGGRAARRALFTVSQCSFNCEKGEKVQYFGNLGSFEGKLDPNAPRWEVGRREAAGGRLAEH